MMPYKIFLSHQDISFFMHFIEQYHHSSRELRYEDSHHDAVAILLHLQEIIEKYEDSHHDAVAILLHLQETIGKGAPACAHEKEISE